MSTTPKHNSDDQEIDLSQISKKFSEAYENFLSWIFSGFLFIKRNIILLTVLFVVGAGIGSYLDRSTTAYNHEVIITPNFGSTEYTYSKVNLINSKIKERDTLFLKAIGINNPSYFSEITILPITDIYNFIDNKKENFELIKLMAEDGDINKIIEDETTSKNYAHHLLKITTKKTLLKKDIKAILNYLNQNEYFSVIQKSIIESIHLKIKANEKTINQIDSILHNFATVSEKSINNDKMVYFNNENSQLNDVLQTKSNLIYELANKKIELLTSDKIVKENSSTLNIKNRKSINGKLKFIIPVILIGFFIFIFLIKKFYRRQMAKLNNK